MPFVSDQVTERLKSFFSSRLEHTGCKPPVSLQADNGTNVHWTRQFTSVVTFILESPKFLTYIYPSELVLKSHDGPGVTRSIIDELNSLDIQGGQVEGGSFDGQYFHLSDLFVQFICMWDPVHKEGVVDNHIPENSSFSWLVEIQTICSEISFTFNWGKNYKNVLQICEDLDIQMKKLAKFQMIRFANSVRFVFTNLRIDYSAVRLALVNVIASKENSSAVKDRSKAEEAKCLLRKINSWVFWLSLSGCAETYNVYDLFSNICQEVNLLPHARLDRV